MKGCACLHTGPRKTRKSLKEKNNNSHPPIEFIIKMCCSLPFLNHYSSVTFRDLITPQFFRYAKNPAKNDVFLKIKNDFIKYLKLLVF